MFNTSSQQFNLSIGVDLIVRRGRGGDEKGEKEDTWVWRTARFATWVSFLFERERKEGNGRRKTCELLLRKETATVESHYNILKKF